jgi:hypothetical protein
MRVWNVILGVLLIGTGVPVLVHHQQHGVVNLWQIVLAFFLAMNTLIALWELCLFFRIGLIEEQHRRFVEIYRGREIDRVRDFFFTRVPLGELVSPSFWSGIWSSYSVFDESYANRRSFGFFVDIGNGFTTLIPSLLFLGEMSLQQLPARALGILGLLLFYQMWYGTVIYLLSFFLNRRHRGHRWWHIAIIVGLSNGLWLVLPVVGCYASLNMIYTDSYAIFVR